MTGVLVTGGAGFIGSNIVEALIRQGYNVRVLDNLSTGLRQNLSDFDAVEFVEGDIRDPAIVNSAVKGCEYIFHQAALPSVSRSVENPLESNACNVTGSLNILEASRKHDVKRVVYASSSSVYGDTETLPKKENMKPNPQSPYAVTKFAMEQYFSVYNKVYGIRSIGLRYFNVYGPRQSPESEYAAVIPKFIKSILNHMPPTIYGDGNQTRDFTYVRDVVKANLLAMNNTAIPHDVFNIGSGKSLSINSLVDSINKIVGTDINPRYEKPRKGDILHSLADITKARETLGYSPEYDIDTGLKETIEWFRRQ